MWIKKSPRELKSDSCRRSVKVCLAAAAAVLLTAFAAGMAPSGLHFSAKWRIAAGVAAGVVVLAWWQRRRWQRVRSNVIVCEKCNAIRTSEDPSDSVCPCGGQFIPLKQMKWMESLEPQDGPPGGGKDEPLAMRNG
jgi:hypothetical protein